MQKLHGLTTGIDDGIDGEVGIEAQTQTEEAEFGIRGVDCVVVAGIGNEAGVEMVRIGNAEARYIGVEIVAEVGNLGQFDVDAHIQVQIQAEVEHESQEQVDAEVGDGIENEVETMAGMMTDAGTRVNVENRTNSEPPAIFVVHAEMEGCQAGNAADDARCGVVVIQCQEVVEGYCVNDGGGDKGWVPGIEDQIWEPWVISALGQDLEG